MEDLEYVVKNSKYVKIDENKIDSFINDLGELNYVHWSKEFNLKLTEEEWILLAFITESMNFCFWRKPKWVVEYNGKQISGSNALFYTIMNKVIKDKTFLNINNLSNLTYEKFKNIFKGISGECPYLEERYQNIDKYQKKKINELEDRYDEFERDNKKKIIDINDKVSKYYLLKIY